MPALYPRKISLVVFYGLTNRSLGACGFHLGSFILVDVLHGANPVHQDENVRLCETSRLRIEKACRRAFARDPDTIVEVRSIDFR